MSASNMKHWLILTFLLWASAVGRAQTASSCSMSADVEQIYYDSDLRILSGVPNTAGFILGGNGSINIWNETPQINVTVGVCYEDSSLACKMTGPQEECFNFIRSVNDLNTTCDEPNCTLYFSGTNSLIPTSFFCNYTSDNLDCSFEASSYDDYSCLDINIKGTNAYQRTKDENATSLYHEGKIYVGVVESSQDAKSLISSMNIDDGVLSDTVQTRTDSDKHVKDAHFVGEPFVIGDYVYFLFRERAVEYDSLSIGQPVQIQKIYSRIARVCADDTGTNVGSDQIWTSYHKQRLVCYEETNDPELYAHFDEIQDFVYENGTIYAVFTNARDDGPMSALCTFSMSDIISDFTDGALFGSASANDLWRDYDGVDISPRPGADCSDRNLGDTIFMLNFVIIKPDALSQTECVIYGDRYSDVEKVGDTFIISSEGGRLHKFQLSQCNPADDCVAPTELEGKPIRDIAVVSDTSGSTAVLATTQEGVFLVTMFSETIHFPEGYDFEVRINSSFEMIIQCFRLPCQPNISNENGDISSTEQPWLLLKYEFLDASQTNTSIHVIVQIVNETVIALPDDPDDVTITTKREYTCDETTERGLEWDAYNATYHQLNNTCGSPPGTFNATDLIDGDPEVKTCSECNYADCADSCPAP